MADDEIHFDSMRCAPIVDREMDLVDAEVGAKLLNDEVLKGAAECAGAWGWD